MRAWWMLAAWMEVCIARTAFLLALQEQRWEGSSKYCAASNIKNSIIFDLEKLRCASAWVDARNNVLLSVELYRGHVIVTSVMILDVIGFLY